MQRMALHVHGDALAARMLVPTTVVAGAMKDFAFIYVSHYTISLRYDW